MEMESIDKESSWEVTDQQPLQSAEMFKTQGVGKVIWNSLDVGVCVLAERRRRRLVFSLSAAALGG